MQVINHLRLIKHSLKVAVFSYFLANKMKLSVRQCKNIFFAGLLHDIGKTQLNKSILYKKNKLTKDEYEYVKQHVVLGVELLKKYKISEQIYKVVEQHHEHEDGTGYPNGLKGDEISVEARILRTVDMYDALISNRAYRKRYTRQQAIEILINENKDILLSLIS